MFGIAVLQLFAAHSTTIVDSLITLFLFTMGVCRQWCILSVLIYLLHWVNGIPALAHVVFTYLLHWANGIPALAHLTYLHISVWIQCVCGFRAQAIYSNFRCLHFHFHIFAGWLHWDQLPSSGLILQLNFLTDFVTFWRCKLNFRWCPQFDDSWTPQLSADWHIQILPCLVHFGAGWFDILFICRLAGTLQL